MVTKFESNVATQIPKTKAAQEPRLPWDVSSENLMGAPVELRAEKAPLGTRAVFLIALLVIFFVSMLSICLFIVNDNKKAQMTAWEKEEAATLLQNDLKQVQSEKRALEETTTQLKKQVDTLNTQQGTFMTVIENLSRTNTESADDNRDAPKRSSSSFWR